MKKILLIALLPVLLLAACRSRTHRREPVDYVNTRIGNISILLVPTFPTTHLPNSMLRMIPTHHEYVTDRMYGFPLNVPSHRQGDVLYLMPYCGDADAIPEVFSYRYDHEVSTPYSYSVFLDDYAISVGFAPAPRSAIYEFDFERDEPAYVLLRTVGGGELSVDGNTFSGYDIYHGIKHYFYLEFDSTPIDTGFTKDDGQVCYARFETGGGPVRARYGISYISREQALRNLRNEIVDFDRAALSGKARKIWNEVLGKISVEGATEDQKTVFYTALYRSHERMIDITEEDRYFCGLDGKVHDAGGIPYYTDDWLWDTYLALHPLMTILSPTEQEYKLESYIRMCENSPEGWMPTFPTVYGDFHAMNGNHAAAMFADALSKGIPFDTARAFTGMKNTVLGETMIPWRRAPKTVLDDFYHENGWFPALHPGEPETEPLVDPFEQRNAAAVTLAASLDDWCIAQLARSLGYEEDYNLFLGRARNYEKIWNAETGFFHPKDKHGRFIEPFDYIFSGGIGARAYYDENNAWTYIWDVHHNISGLIDLFGSREAFIEKLDRLFVEDLKLPKWQYYAVHPDGTGNVGQFCMGNEPSFHIPYLYNYAGQPWKTQKRIRMLLDSWFRNDLMGMPGDEDGGGMAAFVVFSSLGFYPVSPGIPVYAIGSPVFTRSEIKLENGRTFTVEAQGCSRENKYIRSATLNGEPYDKTWITHEDIMSGGTLRLEMGNRPDYGWGVDSPPPSTPDML